MGLFIRQDENRSELQNRVASELQDRMRHGSSEKTLNDHESTLLENQHQTRKAGMIIMLLILVLVVVIIIYAIRT